MVWKWGRYIFCGKGRKGGKTTWISILHESYSIIFMHPTLTKFVLEKNTWMKCTFWILENKNLSNNIDLSFFIEKILFWLQLQPNNGINILESKVLPLFIINMFYFWLGWEERGSRCFYHEIDCPPPIKRWSLVAWTGKEVRYPLFSALCPSIYFSSLFLPCSQNQDICKINRKI